VSDLTIRAVEEQARALARRLVAKAPHLRCPACGHRDFGVLEQPEAGLRTWLTRENDPFVLAGSKKAQHLVTLVCTTCGNLEQFAEAVIQGVDPAQYGEAVGNE
jgi:transcription elongation factor Elf1